MQKTIWALLAVALLGAASCNESEDSPTANHLECPADPAPVKGYGGRGSIVMPNAFSPNGDGKNDVFHIVQKDTLAVRSIVMRIVAADGTLIATVSRSIDGWDGYDRSKGKYYPAGKYRVDYGIVMHGGSGTDVAINGHTCIKLYGTDTTGCLIRQGNPAEDVFADQVDPATSNVIYSTAERICN
jgi:gliding motility-associated-like protein